MTVIVVGSVADRRELRAQAEASGLVVVGEAVSVADARRSSASADAMLVAVSQPSDPSEAFQEDLTARELEVLDLLALGLSNKAIAERLHISDQTVKFHVASLSGKLGASNRTNAVRLAIDRGLVTF